MLKDKLLPLANSPIKVYQFLAYPLAVLLNYEECMPWFYCNFIQLRCLPSKDKGIDEFDFLGSWWFDRPWGYIPWFTYQIINKKTFYKFQDKSRFIREQIDDGWYFYSSVDEYYIPYTKAYNTHHSIHDLLICGYDTNNDFIAYGYSGKQELHTFTVTSTDLTKSLGLFEPWSLNNDLTSFNSDLVFFKKKENYRYIFDMELVYKMLNEYLYSRDLVNRTHFIPKQGNDSNMFVYGMDYYKCLVNYFSLLIKDKARFDIRPLHLLWEHKKCMLLRLEYIYKNNFIPREEKLYNIFHGIEAQTLSLRNLQLKYSINSDKKILERIIKSLEEIEYNERNGINLLIKHIQKNNNYV